MKSMKKSILKLSRNQLLYLGKRVSSDRILPILKPDSSTIVWHVTMPKSGGTWVSSMLGKGLSHRGWKITDFVAQFGNREQEVDVRSLLTKADLNRNNFATYQHCLFSDYTLQFIKSFKVKVILQVRNIFDSVISGVDHMDKEFIKAPIFFMNEPDWTAMSYDRKLQFMFDMVAPWYIRFWAGWSTVLKDTDIDLKLVEYNALNTDPKSMFVDLFNFCDDSISESEVREWMETQEVSWEQTKKNKGVIGRGASVPEALKKQVKHLTSYYPSVDFSPIGL